MSHNKSIRSQIQLINQAISASINSLNLTKQLIRDLERVSGATSTSMPGVGRTVNVPGIIGTYDGENMVTERGEKFSVPQNYASKSGLVFGDTLKRISDGGGFVFKQVQRVKRFRTQGVLVKKEGRWAVVTSDGSYKVLDRTVEHFGLKEGSEVFAILPEGNKNAPFAALDVVRKEEAKTAVPAKKKAEEPVEKKPKGKEAKVAEKPKPTKKAVAEKKPKESAKPVKAVKKEQSPKGEMSLGDSKPKAETSVTLKDDDLR